MLAAFGCFETLAGACRSGPPNPLRVGKPPVAQVLCECMGVSSPLRRTSTSKTEGQAPTRIGVKVSQPPPQVRA